MNDKYVEKPINDIPIQEKLMMERPPLDYYTKPEGSLNVIVQKNIDRIKW